MATSGLSNDTRNFQCVTVASVAVIKLPLRDILANHIQPQDLFQKIQSCSTLKLRQDQLKLCCIPPPDVPDYNKFDVTLLYTLIRNLCSLPRPAQGWGNEPTANDTQISDDIERLRLFRNNFYAHAESAVIADAVFKDVWKNLKLVFRRIQPKMGYSVDYEEELMNIERTKFTDDFLANFRVLLETFAKFEIQTDGRDEPDIFIQGENEIICGSTAQIEAEVKKVESSCWSITWRKRRGDVIKCIDTDMEKYSGSSKKKLVIKSVCKEDEGEYQAVLSPELNGHEYKSRNTIRLHAVGEIPFLTISEVSLGSEGITIHFNCGVLEQSPKVHLIEWSKNGKKLDNKSNKYVGEGIDNRQLTITSPTYEDRGKYNCKVSNAVGSVSKNVMLDVPCVELLEVSPIFCGSKTAIKCVISSTPTPENIEWQTSRDGVDFQSIRRAKYFDNTDNSFVIHKATFADKLYYRLRVWNGIGETISNTVYLNVTGSPPNIKTIPETNIKNRSVKLIGSVIIYDDSPGVKNHFWTRNQKTIDFEECNGRLSETRTDNPSLTITNVGPDDAGEYRLTAMNDVGSFTSEAIVLGVPRVSEEKVEDEDNGGQRITVTIKSIPEPCHVQWSVKRKEDDTFVQIDIYAKEYEGTTVTLPHPVLFVKQKDQLENICFRIEVTNFIGNTKREISGNCTTKQRKIDNVENTIYNDDGEIFEFTILSSTLVKQFPIGKLDHLKFLIKKSNKVKNPASVKEATSVLECIDILQDENLFTPTDVIYMQFLCQEADCFDLFTKCVEYAESKQRALCYLKKPPVNGYKDVQFHVQGDVSGYTKDYINHVIKTVAVILRCKEEDVLLNGAQHSKSFLLSLSIKEPYVRKLLALEVKDRLKLRGLNIDYLIIDGNILDIEIPKEIVENTLYEDHGASVRFTKLNNILAEEFPLEKLKKMKLSLLTSSKIKNRISVLEAKSALDCLMILQTENLFTQSDVIFMQFLCKETECLDLYEKCVEYAEKQRALCYFEKKTVNGHVDVQFHVQGEISGYTKNYIEAVIETVAIILDCKVEDILLNGVRHSTSFLLTLSVKEVYRCKLSALNERDRQQLRKLNIDYLIIDRDIISLEGANDSTFTLNSEYSLQDLLQCHLCRTLVSHSHCVICDKHVCKDCEGKHISDKSKEHKLVPFKLRGCFTKCQKHSSTLSECYCMECDILFCVRCTSALEHWEHKCFDVMEKSTIQKIILQRDLQELEKSIYPEYHKILATIPNEKVEVSENSKKLTTTIDRHGEHLHREIDNAIKKLKSDVFEMDSRYLYVLNKREDAMTRTVSEITQSVAYVKKLLNSNDDSLLSAYKSRNAEFRILPPKLTVSLPRFASLKMDEKQIYQLFGFLPELSIKTEEHGCTVDFRSVESSATKKPLISDPQILMDINTGYVYGLHSVSCLKDEHIWTCSYTDNIINLYNLQGELVKSIQTKSGNTPGGIAVTRSGDLVYTDGKDCSVNIVRNTLINTVIKLRRWRPHGVCCTSSGDLLVVMANGHYGETKVVRYSGSRETQTIQYNDKGTPLYSFRSYKKYICENSNLDICVADNRAGAVVVVNRFGHLRFTYTGSPSTTEGSFDPTGITTDGQGRILIADTMQNCIHILDQNGQFLRYIDNCSFNRPCGLCVDTRDNLFVAEFTTSTSQVKKIHYCLQKE